MQMPMSFLMDKVRVIDLVVFFLLMGEYLQVTLMVMEQAMFFSELT
jgi:hypothetical protein